MGLKNNEQDSKLKTFTWGKLRHATASDVPCLEKALRKQDVEEITYYCELPVHEILQQSFQNSKQCITLEKPNGGIAAMSGVGWTNNPRVGRIWLLSSDYIYEHREKFGIQTKKIINYWMDGHDVIFNHVHDKNIQSFRWLEWLGFTPTDHLPSVGSHSQPFTEFSKFRNEDTKKYI